MNYTCSYFRGVSHTIHVELQIEMAKLSMEQTNICCIQSSLNEQFDGLVQEQLNSIANALE